MPKTALKPQGNNMCLYCGHDNPDSESTCPVTGGRHTLVSHADKEVMGQGYGPGPKSSRRLTTFLKGLVGMMDEPQPHVAHGLEPGDDSVVRHCPFCGSGNVWGKSDGNVHCEFCGKDYTVQVQPEYPQMAQNLNGVPLGQGGVEDAFDDQGNPVEDPAAGGGEPPAPEGLPTASEGGMMPDAGAPPDGDEEGSPEDEEDQGKNSEDEDEDSDDDTPPFLKKKTNRQHTSVRKGWPSGGRLDRHFTDDPDAGGHGWDEEKLSRLPARWRQERHDWAHGLGAMALEMDEDQRPEDPGHEHWDPEDPLVIEHGDIGQHQRYRRSKEANLFFTAQGNVLDFDDMVNHLAIRHARNPAAIAPMVIEYNRRKRG